MRKIDLFCRFNCLFWSGFWGFGGMMNALSSKSAKSPITLVKDNRLFGYTPRRENVTDFLPKKIKIPIPPSMRPDETYPMPTAWNQE